MRPAVALLLVLLLGCTSQAPLEEPAPEINEPVEDLPDTSNISFFREPLPNASKGGELPSFDFSNITDEEGRLIVYYFYSPGCVASKAITPEIDRLEENYPDVVFLRYDLATINGSYAYRAFAAEYGLNGSQQLVPQVLVNGTIVTDRFNINQSLEVIVAAFSS